MQPDPKAARTNLIKAVEEALARADIPTIYFNGFVNTVGNADVFLLLQRNDRAVAMLYMSHTMAKTLAQKLGAGIAHLERETDNTVPTTDSIGEALSKAAGGHDGMAE